MSSVLPKLRLLVISPLPNDAEQIASHLRNAGYATRTRWTGGLAEAEEILEEYHSNLILCADDASDLQFPACVKRLQELRPGIPVLALGERSNQEATIEALKLGARDRVTRSESEYLQLVVLREIGNFMQSRDLDICRARMAEVETRHDALLMEASEPIAYVHEGIHTRANPAYARLFGYDDPEQLEDMPLMDLIHQDDRKKLKQAIKSCLEGQDADNPVALRNLKTDGSSENVDFHVSPIRIGDTDQVEIIARNRGTESKPPDRESGADHTIERYALYEALKKACAPAPDREQVLALFYVAVDGFDEIQTQHGFVEADQVAESLRALLAQSIQESDQLFHFSPGEFILLGGRDSEEDLEQTARHWCEQAGSDAFEATSHILSLTLSIVVCPLPYRGCSPQTALKLARETIRTMGNKLGNEVRVVPISDGDSKEKLGDQFWLKRIKQALRYDQFELTYQSIASLEGEENSRFEVTVRMLDERNQEIRAAEFMPTAERHGLTQALDRWVVQHALEVMKRQKEAPLSQLFIKLAEDSLTSRDFLSWLKERLDANQPLTPRLIFEFKAPMVQHLGKAALAVAKMVKASGAGMALERVGASPGILSMLGSLPLDYIKLDPSLTENLESDEDARGNITRIMEHARGKSIKTIAERVEKANSMAILWQLGVNFVQGYYVQEPEVVLVAHNARLP